MAKVKKAAEATSSCLSIGSLPYFKACGKLIQESVRTVSSREPRRDLADR
jgi:hypothetical protein